MENKEEYGKAEQEKKSFDEARRDFLRKSLHAAYATPVIMSIMVEKASAAASRGLGVACSKPNVCKKDPRCWELYPDKCPP